MHTWQSKWKPGNVVYRRLETDREPGLVIAVMAEMAGAVAYRIHWSDGTQGEQYEQALTDQKFSSLEEELLEAGGTEARKGCAYCGQPVNEAYSWWTANPEKGTAQPIHQACWPKWTGGEQ